MISAWEVYLFTRLDAVNGFAVAGIFFAVLAFAAFCVFYLHNTEESGRDWNSEKKQQRYAARAVANKKYAIWALLLLVFFVAISLLVPTTKEAAVIYLLPKIANNEQVQKVPENFVKLLNTKMEMWVADFEKDKKKKEDK